ncbi:hypothetical protein [Pedobacter sp. MW01-1-1]|uniref:hypothetical protein n=1 Tax=Pedobacter sp. MW01-1-1 TaxID=3383027 RepID=UPI003FEE6CDE
MKKIYKIFSFILLATVLLNSCKNPSYDINVLFDADVIKYKATLVLKDANGATLPSNISVTATGTDAASIYDFSGTKTIYAPAGVATLGVTPKGIPTANKPVMFNVLIKAPGYDDKNIPVSIVENQFSQIIYVTLLKTMVPSPAATVVSQEIPLAANGAITTAVSFSTPTSSTVATTTSITVPAGTQFKDAAGNTLTGGTVTAQAVNFDPSDPAALALFPGGQLSSTNVVGPSGSTGEMFFLPAGFTEINMYVGGVAVRNFTTPINVAVQLDPTFKPQATGKPIAAGDVLGIYSYQTSTGQFKFESNGTVVLDGQGKPSVSFSTNHLTVFIVGDAIVVPPTCQDPKITYSASWLGVGTQPFKIELIGVDGKTIVEKIVSIGNNTTDVYQGLPPLVVRYKISTTAATPVVVAEGIINDPCAGANITITLRDPGVPVQNITLLLNVRCPGSGTILVPNFDLFYKPAGAPASQYTYLGTAENGSIKTTVLKIGSAYDFRTSWRNSSKEVLNRTITQADNSTTVGENDFLGDKSPQANKALLIEACKNL